MAVLHLQFDIDSEVHPELHDMLSSIGSSRSQAERLRQLAAAGLVWERLRLQAYGRFEVPELGPRPEPALDFGAALPGLGTAAATPAVPRPGACLAAGPDGEDFVDLSDVVDLRHPAYPERGPQRPGEHRLEPVGAGPVVAQAQAPEQAFQVATTPAPPASDAPELLPVLPLHEIRSAVQALPVLTEIVAAAELPQRDATGPIEAAASPDAGHAERGDGVSGGARIHELAPARKTATRSRLMRMKEKGLFKNE